VRNTHGPLPGVRRRGARLLDHDDRPQKAQEIMTGARFPTRTLVAAVALALLAVLAPPARANFLTYVQTLEPGVDGVTGITSSYGAAVSPDGKHVYIAGSGDDAVVTFGRDPASGALTWLGVQQNGVNGVDGLEGPDEVLVSPDGRHVYVAAFDGDAVAVFARDTATGHLTHVQHRKQGVGGIQGLGSPFGLAISPDGAYLYAVETDSSSVTVFARDTSTGALALVEEKFEGLDGVGGMQRPQRIAISPDGAHVYVAGGMSNSVVVFSRDAATGSLTFVEKQEDGVNGVAGLYIASAVAVSGDGKHLYACGFGNAVVVFARNAATGALTWVESEHEGVGGVTGIAFAGRSC
jgi:6-phosphogluconolactonase (cycloisomerase 2 family)